MRYASVLVDDSGGNAFTYAVPEKAEATIVVGSRVRVPVRTRTMAGTVIALNDATDVEGVKPIAEVVGKEPVLTPLLLRLGEWIADYYCCSLEAALRAVLPVVVRRGEGREKTQLFARLARPLSDEEIEAVRTRAPLQAGALEFLAKAAEPVAISRLAEECDAGHAVVQALKKKELILVESRQIERDPFENETFVHAAKLELNAEQAGVFAKVRQSIEQNGTDLGPKPMLLFGVTGSGKTEIYLQAIEQVLDRGQGAIMLVPEISLTPQTVERFKSRFAATHHEVAVLHSHLSEGERHDEWHKIRSGRARIAIGARSAIFAPVQKLGLVVVDEEHENSYKQEETPRYHGRDIAVLRGRLE
jgi:primosomal protein N' (replication factor Y)